MNQDIIAFEKFFREFYASVLRYCVTIVGNTGDAEDIVSQVFLSIWKMKQDCKPPVSEKAYLYKAVLHASLDFLKHEKVKKSYSQFIHSSGTKLVQETSAEETELKLKIEQAIEGLPEQCRKIFTMNRFQHVKYRDIAKELGIAEKTVENQVGKALKMLREALKDWLPLLLIFIHLSYGQ